MEERIDPAVAPLLTEWERLRDAPEHARSAEWPALVRALAKRVVAARSQHMLDNAEAQAVAAGPDAPGLREALAAHERAIKACTVALGEMSASLGRGV